MDFRGHHQEAMFAGLRSVSEPSVLRAVPVTFTRIPPSPPWHHPESMLYRIFMLASIHPRDLAGAIFFGVIPPAQAQDAPAARGGGASRLACEVASSTSGSTPA